MANLQPNGHDIRPFKGKPKFDRDRSADRPKRDVEKPKFNEPRREKRDDYSNAIRNLNRIGSAPLDISPLFNALFCRVMHA